MNSPYNYINAANRHGLNRDHNAFVRMITLAARAGHITATDTPSLFKAYRLGYDEPSLPPVKVLHHPVYGSLTRQQWFAQLKYLHETIVTARKM